MKNTLIKQAFYLPIIYFGTIIIASLFANNYSQIGQQVSELALNDNPLAITAFSIGIFITGISLLLYGIGLFLDSKNQFTISSVIVVIFGISFIGGALIPVGSPWHSLYGLPFCIMLLPFAFLSEIKIVPKYFKLISIIITLIMFLYFWNILASNLFMSFDYRGLTQRIFGIAIFGWFSYSAYTLNKLKTENKTTHNKT